VVSFGEVADEFVRAIERLDMDGLDGESCAGLVARLARIERLVRLAKTQAAMRATSGGVAGRDGAPDAASWLARESGETVGAASAAFDTLDALRSCPATAEAVAAGLLSLGQAKEIASAASVNASCESELVELAKRAPLSTLRDQSRKRRHEVLDAVALHDQQVAARRFRWWRNDLGNVAYAGELPPEQGVPFVNRLDAETDRLWRAARRSGAVLEAREAYAADALAAMTNGQGRGRGRAQSADVVVVVDLNAWRRDHAEPGEVCHIIGGGGTPVPVAKELAADAFFKAVIHDGENILTLAHFGRKMKAELRSALGLGAPPHLDGLTCVDVGCGRKHGLQFDHVDPVANNGPTAYSNIQARCTPSHADKTERDRQAGLLGPKAKPRARAPTTARR